MDSLKTVLETRLEKSPLDKPVMAHRKKLPEQGVPIKTTTTINCRTDEAQPLSNRDVWMTTEEAASYLRISPATLRNVTSNGKIPVYKLGRRNRYLKSDLDDLLRATKRGGNTWEPCLTKKLDFGRRTTVNVIQKPRSQRACEEGSSDQRQKQEERSEN